MFKGIKFGAVVALVIALTACSGSGGDEQPNNEPVGVANVEETTNTTPEPLVAETPDKSAADADETFIKYVREELPAKTSIPNATDEQLIAAGHDACEQIASGFEFPRFRERALTEHARTACN